MNVNCSTCLEVLTPSADLSSVPCGHVFHSDCIVKWFNTGKSSCPQCRTKFRTSQLRRIYFTAGMDVSMNSQDPSVIHNKLDSLTLQVRCLETDKKAAVEERDQAVALGVALREEVKFLESRLASAKEEVLSYKAQNSLLHGEKRLAERTKKEAEELREKLELYKNVEFVVNASASEVNHKMHQMGDFSKESKGLCYMVTSLSKELESKGKESSSYRKELSQKQYKIDELKGSVSKVLRSNATLVSDNDRLTSDNQHLEEEVKSLKTKVAYLKEAISSPSGDPRQSVIDRLVSESPAPEMNLKAKEKDVSASPHLKKVDAASLHSPVPPFATTSECGIIGLNKAKSFQHPMKDSNIKRPFSLSQPASKTTAFVKKIKFHNLESPSGKSYDGLGGHSKPDDFPMPRSKVFKINVETGSKIRKPKGVSRPKAANAKYSASKPIDSFFSAIAELE